MPRRVASFALTVLLTALFAAPASATFPGANGKIFYSSNLAGPTRDLYRINPDGSGAQRLTGLTAPFDEGDEDKPSVSPDGKAIAFVFEPAEVPGEEERYDIYLVNRDGTNPRLVRAGGSDPAWSPDGTKIAYTSISDDAGYQLGVMNADGTDQHLITPPDLTKSFYAPDWSADGTRIVFTRRIMNSTAPVQIGTVKPDGTGRQLITQMTSKNAYDPYWAPDSQRIVFTQQTPTESEVWVMNKDGGAMQQLTDGHFDLHATWSPNGLKVVFASERDIGFQLFTMPVAGGPLTQVTKPPAGAPQTLRQWRPYWDPQH